MKKELILLDLNVTEETAGIVFALNRLKHIEIAGISLCFGETSLESSHRSISGLVMLMGWTAPIALGADRPWRRDYQLPVSECDISDAINGLQIDVENICEPSDLDAADFLYEKLKEAGGDAKILCAGCLTNIAILLERYPDAGKLIRELIWCGGTQRHAKLQVVKDYQTYLDPEATEYVLEQGLNLTMCPVDAGMICYMTQEEIDSRMYEKEPVMHQFNRLLKKRWCDANAEVPMGERHRILPLQEMAAVAAAALPELCGKNKRYGEVDLKGKLTFGMLVIDINNRLEHTEEEMNISQVTYVNREKLIHLLYMD